MPSSVRVCLRCFVVAGNGDDNELDGLRGKVSWDLLHLHNDCLWYDSKILFRIIRVVITGNCASENALTQRKQPAEFRGLRVFAVSPE